MTNQPTCSTCRFFRKFPVCSGGRCHRYPPSDFINEPVPVALWPEVREDAWCGEHQDATTPTAQRPRLLDPAWRDRLSTRAKNCIDSDETTDNQILGEHGLAYLMCIRNSGKTIAHEILNKCREAYGLPPHGKR
jgi:hypothetical protein